HTTAIPYVLPISVSSALFTEPSQGSRRCLRVTALPDVNKHGTGVGGCQQILESSADSRRLGRQGSAVHRAVRAVAISCTAWAPGRFSPGVSVAPPGPEGSAQQGTVCTVSRTDTCVFAPSRIPDEQWRDGACEMVPARWCGQLRCGR